MNSSKNVIDKAVISIWHAKPIWALNLNFDDGEVERLDETKYVEGVTGITIKDQADTMNSPVNCLENAVMSIWNSKSIWSLNLNFDDGEVDKLKKKPCLTSEHNDDLK